MRRRGATRAAAVAALVALGLPLATACAPEPGVAADRSREGAGPTEPPDETAPATSDAPTLPTLPPLPSIAPGSGSSDGSDPNGSDPADADPAGSDPAGSDPAGTGPDQTGPDETGPDETGQPGGQQPGPADPDGIGDPLFPALGNPGIDVQDYAVVLRYDPAADVITGSVTLTIDLTEARDRFTLDSSGPDVEEVAIAGEAVEFEEDDPELRITPAEPLRAGDRIVVDVRYRVEAAGGGQGAILPVGWFRTTGGSYVLNEPDGARTWLPSNDHPSDKATWTFDLTVPTGTAAIANGMRVSTEDTPAGSRWVWRQDDPMSTYLVQLLTGDYELVEGTGPSGLPLLSVVLREDRAEMEPYLASIAEQIDYFDDWFGPYPLDGYGIAMTDSVPGLAMETQGRSLFSRGDFSGSLGATEQLLLSHELAHQWFGDAVSPATWQDIWLNESFATYGQWMWFEHVGLGDLEAAATGALAARSMSAYGSTGTPTEREMFGFNAYDGGAVVLHALRRTIGDDAFFELLQRWVAENVGTSRTSADFIALAQQVSEQDLAAFFDTWLYGVQLPSEFPQPA